MQYEQWKLHCIERKLEKVDEFDVQQQNCRVHSFELDEQAEGSERQELLQELSRRLERYGENFWSLLSV